MMVMTRLTQFRVVRGKCVMISHMACEISDQIILNGEGALALSLVTVFLSLVNTHIWLTFMQNEGFAVYSHTQMKGKKNMKARRKGKERKTEERAQKATGSRGGACGQPCQCATSHGPRSRPIQPRAQHGNSVQSSSRATYGSRSHPPHSGTTLQTTADSISGTCGTSLEPLSGPWSSSWRTSSPYHWRRSTGTRTGLPLRPSR